MNSEKENQQVAAYWAWVAKRKELGYWNVPGWQEHQNLLATGREDYTWIDFFAEELKDFSQSKVALSLGCGSGWLEKILIEKEICHQAEGCDISADLVLAAQKRAEELLLPIKYFVDDLNQPAFPAGKYDLVVGAGIFHHIANLENLFESIIKCLKKNGKLILYDYVGPSRFQWTEKQIEYCNKWLQIVPKRLLKKRGYPWYYYAGKSLFDTIPFIHSNNLEQIARKFFPKKILSHFLRIKSASLCLNKVERPPVEHFLVTDPSEAIRSSDILPLISQYFRIEKLVPLGGTLVQPIFSRTVANFLHDKEGKVWVEKILDDERKAIHNGELPSDLVALIAVPILK